MILAACQDSKNSYTQLTSSFRVGVPADVATATLNTASSCPSEGQLCAPYTKGSVYMQASSLRDRIVDVAEELYKFSMMLRDHSAFLVDRFSERKEKREKGRLLSQAEKESLKKKDVAATG